VTRAQRHLAGILLVIASLLAAAGCVSVPVTGPIEKVEGQQPPCQNCVNVEVAPPAAGDEPRQIVEGYLRATSNHQPNYSVARQFLTKMAAEKWSSEGKVSIYRGSVTVTGETTVMLKGQLVGSLEPDRTYTALGGELEWTFELLKENGEWRIDKPPPGLMVAEYSFKSFYQPYDLYFVGNGSSLVPDPIYLPALSNPANVASALMKALLNGPSKWLKPAASSVIPPNTSLSVDSVTITDGTAQVQLSDSVLALQDPQRSLLAAQIIYTLKQVGGVKSVVIKVNQQPYRVPGSDPSSPAISVDAISRDIEPIPFVSGDQLYAVPNTGRGVEIVSTDSRESHALDPLGRYTVDRLAVSVTGTDLAFTVDNATTLRRVPLAAPGPPRVLLSGASELLRPQFTRYGELWEIGRKGGRQRMWVSIADKKPVEINLPVQNVTAFRISPDGTRMALVRSTETGHELGLARIIRSDQVTVDGWRRLAITQAHMPQIGRIADVAWLDATELIVLGAAGPDSAFAPFRVAEDASRITTEGAPEKWDAAQLTVLPRAQTAIIIARNGDTWMDNGSQWIEFQVAEGGVRTIAYPG
jgi:hypothetical protein